jgi:hypothetical protein
MARSTALIDEHRKNHVRLAEHARKSERPKERPKPNLESEISGSRRAEFLPSSAQISVGGDVRGAIACPTGSLKNNNDGVCFITHRHWFDETKQCYVDKVFKVGDKITVHMAVDHNGPPRTGEIVSLVCPQGDDVMRLYTDVPSHGLGRVDFGKPKIGAACYMHLRDENGKWCHPPGIITGEDGKFAYYTCSTAPGDCGYPITQADGKVVAMHLYGCDKSAPGGTANAGCNVGYVGPPKVKTFVAPEFFPNPFGPGDKLQGRCAGRAEPRVTHHPERFRLVEGFKVRGLRTDKNLLGLLPEHHMAKPSTQMCFEELGKYHDTMLCNFDKDKFLAGVKAAIAYDVAKGSFESPFVPVTHQGVLETISSMRLDRSAGPTAEGISAEDYLLVLGKGNAHVGMHRLAERVLRIYNAACDPEASSDTDKELLKEVGLWGVFGKLDKYKLKKLPTHDPPGTGRTIQAPCLELKVLWKVCFGENDYLWSHRAESWVRSGGDEDLPVSFEYLDALMKAKGAIATDLTAYDRYMMACMIRAFFLLYLRYVCPGAPILLLHWLASVVTHGPLLLTDGRLISRDHGNPSGFMNTLRLNCVVHLFVLAYIVIMRTGIEDPVEVARLMEDEMCLSFCGDDSGHLALSERAMEIFDIRNRGAAYLKAWDDYTPWPEVKLEECCTYDDGDDLFTRVIKTPPMVGRKLVMIQGRVFAPLLNVSRTLVGLSSAVTRTREEEVELVNSAFASLALQIWWQSQGWYYSPAIDYLWREYRRIGNPRTVTERVSKIYRNEFRQLIPDSSRSWVDSGCTDS